MRFKTRMALTSDIHTFREIMVNLPCYHGTRVSVDVIGADQSYLDAFRCPLFNQDIVITKEMAIYLNLTEVEQNIYGV